MRINAFQHRYPPSSHRPSDDSSGFREILEAVGRYEQNAERALRRVQHGHAQVEDLLALQVEVHLWSQSTDLFTRAVGQMSRAVQELARSAQ